MPWTMFISLAVLFIALTVIMFWQAGFVFSDWVLWCAGILVGILIEKYCRRKERQWNGFTK